MLGKQRKLLKRNALSISIGMALAITSSQSLANCGTVTNGTTQVHCDTTATSGVDANLVINGANITSTHTAISVTSDPDDAKATLTANGLTINTPATGHGIVVSGRVAEVNFSGNNSITLGSNTDTTILVSSKHGSSLTVDGVLNINNQSTSNTHERDGIELNIWARGSGDAVLNHNGTGEIKTLNGHAVYLQAHGSSGDAIANLSGGQDLKLTTSGDNDYGISATTTKGANTHNTNGNVIINTNATIKTHGEAAHGIFAETINGAIDIENSGSVTTEGISSSGIHAQTQTGGVRIINNGNITLNDVSTTASLNTSGIFVGQMGSGAAGNVYIENTGNISGSSNNNAAIRVITDIGITAGDITVKHLAGLLDMTGYNSDGIVVNTKGEHSGLIDILVQGDINVGGPTGIRGNQGIYATHSNAASTGDIQVVNEGKISTIDNTGSNGIEAVNQGSGKVTVVNRRESSTMGSNAHAIKGNVNSGLLSIGNTGLLKTSGAGSFGISAHSASSGNINIINEGEILTEGNNSHGIRSSASDGDTLISNSGTIQANGNGSHGIYAESLNGGGKLDIVSSGTIITNGAGSSGIQAYNTGSSGDITITTNNAIFDINGTGSDGILAANNSASSDLNIKVITNGGQINILKTPTTPGSSDGNYGIYAKQHGAAAGDIAIVNNGTKIDIGLGQDNTATNSSAINAIFFDTIATGNISIINSGELSTQASGSANTASAAIYARNEGQGNVDVSNIGNITTQGDSAYGIHAIANEGGNVTIGSHGNILIDAASHSSTVKGIAAIANNGGNATVTASGNISILGNASSGVPTAIEARSNQGDAVVNYSNGTAQSYNTTIIAWGNAQDTARHGEINLGDNALVKSTIDYALKAIVAGGNTIRTAQSSRIEGAKGIQLHSINANAVSSLEHAGSIDVLSDLAISDLSVAGTTTNIINDGTINGHLTLGASNAVVTNRTGSIWELRNFADTDGDGIRDTKGVAVMDFGAGNDTFFNETGATLRLSAVSGAAHNEPAGEYLVTGALSSFNEGTVHGQLLNLNRFENRGTIDLSANEQAGDLLIVTGSSIAGYYGGGQFVSDGGTLLLDTHLNKGGSDSLSDILVVDDVTVGANGPTKIIINRVEGNGELTVGNGIKVVEVLGDADAKSFELGNVVKGGIYEYTLHQGEFNGASPASGGEQHWYLRNHSNQLNPDLGTYLSNQTAATGLFIHSLHDRLGEPQYAERYSRDGSQPSMWVRAISTNTKNEAGGGLLGQNTTGSLVHMGGDIAQWTSSGDSRYHLGLMAAYGKSETTSRSHTTGSRSKGKIDGYGAGAYFTWYSNESMPEGTYVDLWSMYNWFDNEVEGAAKYDSNAWTSSLEIGHAVTGWQGERMQVMIEPHGQVAYTTYRADEHSDNNGLKVNDEDADGFYTRLGARTYLRDSLNTKKAQPFIEANWLHSTAKNTLRFNGIEMADNTPKDRLEVKVGVQGEITQNLQVYSHIGLQWGKDDYSKSEGMLGLKYRF